MIGRLRDLASRRGGLLGAVAVLVGGTALAQVVTALALPILTRLYTPADFSLLAVFAGLLSVLSVAACLRYEIAIALPESDEDAANVLALALLVCLVVSVVAGIVLATLHAPIAAWINQPALAAYLWLLGPGILLLGSQGALQAWMLRRKRFRPVARARIAQALAGSAVQVAGGLAGMGASALLAGQVASTGIGSLSLARRAHAESGGLRAVVTLASMRRMARHFYRLPKYSALEALANAAGMHLPLVIVAAAAGAEAGFVMLAMTAMQGPMALIGNAVAQVYLSHAAERHREGELAAFTSGVLQALLKAGLGPLAFAFIVAPEAFALLFGEEWRRAGELVRWMSPWFVMQFLAVPVGMALHVSGHQKAALALQVTGLLLRVGIVWGALHWQPQAMSEAYAVSGFVFYALYLGVVLWSTGSRPSDLGRGMVSAMPVTLAWLLAAGAALGIVVAARGWIA